MQPKIKTEFEHFEPKQPQKRKNGYYHTQRKKFF